MRRRSLKLTFTPLLFCFILCLITCIISVFINYAESGFNRPVRILFLLIVFVIPALIWLEQAIVKYLRKRMGIVLLIETIVLILIFILISQYPANAAGTIS
jgi:cytochrome bd-type quinol oxidase subunit 2